MKVKDVVELIKVAKKQITVKLIDELGNASECNIGIACEYGTGEKEVIGLWAEYVRGFEPHAIVCVRYADGQEKDQEERQEEDQDAAASS